MPRTLVMYDLVPMEPGMTPHCPLVASMAPLRVIQIEMRNDSDLVDYYLFYGTGHSKGLEKMKEAMWKVDPSGRFRFSDATDPDQLALFGNDPDLPALERLLVDQFEVVPKN